MRDLTQVEADQLHSILMPLFQSFDLETGDPSLSFTTRVQRIFDQCLPLFPCRVTLPVCRSGYEWLEVKQWLAEMIGSTAYTSDEHGPIIHPDGLWVEGEGATYYFRSEEDAVHFKLRWY